MKQLQVNQTEFEVWSEAVSGSKGMSFWILLGSSLIVLSLCLLIWVAWIFVFDQASTLSSLNFPKLATVAAMSLAMLASGVAFVSREP